jgi:hypothetical protein
LAEEREVTRVAERSSGLAVERVEEDDVAGLDEAGNGIQIGLSGSTRGVDQGKADVDAILEEA